MKDKAFSMVELIVVIAIIAVLSLLAAPAFEQMLKGLRITIAGTAMIDHLNLARQTALSRNLPVEFRFYLLPDEHSPSRGSSYRAMQSFLVGERLQPLSKVVYFPDRVVIWQDADAASPKSTLLLTLPPATRAGPADPALPGVARDYSFVQFRFKANGGTTGLGSDSISPFVTLVAETEITRSFPDNFVTIQIDSISGRPRLFRP